MFDLTGKIALITGATGGIGQAIAKQMKDRGAKLILSGTRENVLNQMVKDLGDDVKSVVSNLQDKDSILSMAKDAEACHGKIDILVNNAGITIDGLLMRMKDEDWDTVINVNLTACMRLTRQVLRGMLKRRYGRIIFISSIVGYTGNAGQSNYSASKSGLIGLSKSLAAEVASRGITCNLVAPGFISTPMTDKLTEDQKNNIIKNIPVDRLGSPQDISAACVYLASEESSFITGTTLHVNGGMAML
ncbi:3-oxoacyl-[acyl-carrier-protein] reductase [Alphaproteobacteria bacterium]|jgi:3-oxoacyl-[acyl-carrier protein] reductase|nr:3-oxoacyl-[acyl-carrier-protein] reductase [Alphaproteobacteria bacterium]|tara:strand:+ start:8193 stop:8930 length:738 start_codon:yes stop_codon:yes gene_type:complete